MAVTLVTVTGNLETLTGATPSLGRIWFKLNRPDWNLSGDIFAPEYIEAIADVDGAFSMALQSTDDFETGATYSAILKYREPLDGKDREYTLGGRFPLPAGGPWQLGDLLTVPIIAPVPADILALCQAYALAAEADRAASELARDEAVLYGGVQVDTPPDLYALTSGQVAVGQWVLVRSTGWAYQRAADAAFDHDLLTPGGLKLYVPTNGEGEYVAEQLADWADANAAQNTIIAHANRKGSLTKGTAPLTYRYSAQTYDLRAGARTALLAASVTFKGVMSKLRLRDAPFVELGAVGSMAETIRVEGFSPDCSDVPIRSVKTITGATQANPVSITATAHGYLTGEKVRLFDVVGMTQIDDVPFTITVVNANTFTLNGINGTAYGAYVSGGEVRPETDSALVKIINAARIVVRDIKPVRMTHLVKADPPAGCGVSTVDVSDCRLDGHESYDWIAMHTRNAAFGAGLFVKEVSGYPTNVPANPIVLPRPITGATQANPVAVTCTAHGLATGDIVRLSAVGGMTQISGLDFTITVVNANSFTLDGINGTGYSAYTSGGWVNELHWSQPFDTGVVLLNGKWDTARISGGPYMHYAWLWRLRSSGQISFVWEDDARFDYGGKGRIQAVLDGGGISYVQLDGGWHWALDEKFIDLRRQTGATLLNDFKVTNMVVGLTGDSFVDDSANLMINVEVSGCTFGVIGRARRGVAHWINAGASVVLAAMGNVFTKPQNRYGAFAATAFVADKGVTIAAGRIYTVTDNTIAALTTHYDMALAFSGANVRDRMIRANRCVSGVLPEYIAVTGPAAPASGVAVVNYTGLTMLVNLRGGTITSVSKNGTVILSGIAAYSFAVLPGESWSVNYTVIPTLVYSFSD